MPLFLVAAALLPMITTAAVAVVVNAMTSPDSNSKPRKERSAKLRSQLKTKTDLEFFGRASNTVSPIDLNLQMHLAAAEQGEEAEKQAARASNRLANVEATVYKLEDSLEEERKKRMKADKEREQVAKQAAQREAALKKELNLATKKTRYVQQALHNFRSLISEFADSSFDDLPARERRAKYHLLRKELQYKGARW